MVIPIVIGALGTIPFCKGAGRAGNRRTNRHHQNYSIVAVDQNTEESPDYLKRLAVSQTQLKDSFKTRVKNSQGVKQ